MIIGIALSAVTLALFLFIIWALCKVASISDEREQHE